MWITGLAFAKVFPATVSVAALDIAGYFNSLEFRALLADFLSAFIVALGSLFLNTQGTA
jgi:hypothetical protein